MSERRKESFSIQVLQIVDAVVVLAAFMGGLYLWNWVVGDWVRDMGWARVEAKEGIGVDSITPILYLVVPFIPLSLELFGFYRRYGRQNLGKAVWRILQALGLVLLAYMFLAVLLKFSPHRPTLVMGFVFSGVLLWMREAVIVKRTRSRAKRGIGKLRLLLAGRDDLVEKWWDDLDGDVRMMYERVGVYSIQNGDLDALRQQLSRTAAERVVFLAQDAAFEQVTLAIEECEIQGVEVWLAADFVRARICQPTFDSLGGTPMLVLRSTPSLSWSILIKDVMDRVGAFILILVTSPFWLMAYVGIKIQSPGPVFYKQERAGRFGNPFWIWKFRTMDIDADKKLQELKEQQGNQMSGPVFKLDDDPRIFAFGQFMRKYSIDELPQLINVLMGEMSLVGPRPMAMYELPDIEKSEHRRKLSVKPGITCIWQVSGRNEITSFEDWVQLDLKYIDNWSLWLDIKILLQTLPAVLFSKGAK